MLVPTLGNKTKMPWRFDNVWALAFAALVSFGSACTASTDVEGVWRAKPKANPLVFNAAGDPIGIEIVIGEYGPDATGVVHFYRTQIFDVKQSALAPLNQCACAYLHDGSMDLSSNTLHFRLRGCVQGAATQAELPIYGELTLDVAGNLVGTLTVETPGGAVLPLTFSRRDNVGQIDPADLVCAHPTEAEGNSFSGR